MGLKNFFENIFKKDEVKEEDIQKIDEEVIEDEEKLEEDLLSSEIDEVSPEKIEESKNTDNNNSFKKILDSKEKNINIQEDFKESFKSDNETQDLEIHSQDNIEDKQELQEDTNAVVEQEKKGLFARLKEGLKKTSNSFTSKFDNLFKGYIKIDNELYEEIEEILITSDISFETTIKIVENLKSNIKKKNINDINLVKPELKEVVSELLRDNNSKLDVYDEQSIIIIVGVNGVGKTTTIGKLASKFKKEGKSVLLAAGDTFRAAAEEQLEIWSKRADVDIVRHKESGSDPSAVIFDAMQKAKSKNIDILICDTAGRLHNKVNLMNELGKIMRTVNKEYPDAKKEILLVIDATTGQNALNQVKTFNEAVNLTGVILTKLDGTAKGGVVLSIIDEYKIPIKFIGVGEKVDDLQEFDYNNFVEALFDNSKE